MAKTSEFFAKLENMLRETKRPFMTWSITFVIYLTVVCALLLSRKDCDILKTDTCTLKSCHAIPTFEICGQSTMCYKISFDYCLNTTCKSKDVIKAQNFCNLNEITCFYNVNDMDTLTVYDIHSSCYVSNSLKSLVATVISIILLVVIILCLCVSENRN